jgi:SOS response regulatory protein OraA/RecX
VRRGIDGDAVVEALKSYTDIEERATALTFLTRKLSPSDPPQKAARMLAAKGFSEETVRCVLEGLFPGLEC